MRSLLVLSVSTAVCATSIQRRSTTDPNKLSGKTFDFVIVGGGTAGLALAGRLAEWSNITVAVIEAGSDGTEYQDQITIPGMSYLKGLTKSSYDWQYQTTPQANAGGNPLSWPRGKGLGGSSAINGGFWCRGSSAEYDAWNTLQNGESAAQDWGWNTMQSAIKKCETFTPMADDTAAAMSVTHDINAHGTNGPIQTSYSSFQFPQLSNWVPTMVAMGLPHAQDPANGSNVGVSFVPSIINPKNGSRSDSNFGYIAPYSRPNLVILTGFQATKINWNSTTAGNAVAGGVTFAASAGGQTYSVNAAKEVIMSGGTIGTPQVLQLSGVGPKSLITGLGIKSVVDLPGVGANLQDHLSVSISMKSSDTNTWGNLRAQDLWDEQLDVWRKNGTGMWTYWNEATAYPAMADLMGDDTSNWVGGLDLSKALSTSASASSMDPTVQAGVKAQYDLLKDWAGSKSIGQVELIFNMLGGTGGDIGVQFCLQHGFSRGYVQINSASAFDAPEINPNYLSVSYDADIMRSTFKYVRRIMQTAPASNVITSESYPGSATTADVDIDWFIAHNSGTEYHPTGTSSMLPLSLGGVVNTTLVVYGTANVRVVDVSIAPLTVSAHTMATAYGVAERAADLIKTAYAATTSSNPDNNGGGSKGSDSGDSNQPNNNNTTNSKSTLSTGTKIAIGAASGAAAVVLLMAFLLLRRRNSRKQQRAMIEHSALPKDDPWHSADDLPMQPRAPFMAGMPKRHSAQPSQYSVETEATLTHPDNQQHVEYGQEYFGSHPQHTPYSPYTDASPPLPPVQYSPYGAVHSDLHTADVAPLHSPSTPHSPPARYTDSGSPLHGSAYSPHLP
ncbi:choline dehydrogenase [Favolaschia claudopus]|uniref:Choline dehydrogenase n=1 Tax=Favolaschia claudopus TaxID=2862362 RepID=A0AAW0EDP6_9AGAR